MRRRPSLRAVSLALLASLLGCGAEDRPAGNATSARTGAPGIVLLCIDTLRADGVTLVPGAKGFMPALDAFARGATAFSDASSSSSWTAPSIATLLTGLLPENTGVRGAFTAGTLVGAVTTIAETLREHGFSTAASTAGGWISPHLGFGQGFESFSTRFDADGPEAAIAAWDAARAKAKPFFLFLHTVAAHDPYGPKDRAWGRADLLPLVAERAMALYRETKDAGWKLQPGAAPWFLELFLYGPQARHTVGEALGAESWDHLWTLVLDWLDGEGRGSPELAAIAGKAAAAYREGLAYADRVFAKALAALEALKLPAETVVIVVGDHGEALGEHGTLLHARWLYDEMTRVPLVIRAPGRLGVGRVVPGSCGLVDVVPTLLDLAGVAAPAGLDGRSLLPLARGEEAGRPIFSEEERRRVGEGGVKGVRVLGVRTAAAKAFVTFDLASHAILETELYDLAADPAEARSLPLSEAARFGDDFCRGIAALYARIPGRPAAPVSCGPR